MSSLGGQADGPNAKHEVVAERIWQLSPTKGGSSDRELGSDDKPGSTDKDVPFEPKSRPHLSRGAVCHVA